MLKTVVLKNKGGDISMLNNGKAFKMKVDKMLGIWLTTTVMIGIFGLSALMASFMLYPHAAANPVLAERIGWTSTDIQTAEIKSQIAGYIGALSVLICLLSLAALLVVAFIIVSPILLNPNL